MGSQEHRRSAVLAIMSATIKNVAIFGGTGMTGLVTLPQAVAAGYNVTVLVRDPSRLPPDHKASRVVVGDVLNKEDVRKTMEGQDAVIIILGTRNDLSPTTMMSEGTRNILEAMKARGIRKVIACMSAFLLWDRSKVPPRLVAVTEDHDRMYTLLKESGLDYVAVMPPHIDDKHPLTENYMVTENALKGRVISKHDLGHFFVKCLSISDWDGKTVGLWGQYKELLWWSMMAKGQKRKFPWDLDGVYENQRQYVLDISLGKFQHMHSMLETSLRYKVLVGNTLRKIQEEIHLEDILTKEINPCNASLPSASAETFPQVGNSDFPENPGDAWSVLSSEEELSLLSAINCVLKDLDVVCDGPQPYAETPFASTGNATGASGAGDSVSMETGILGGFEIIQPCYITDVERGNPFCDIDTFPLQQELAYLESQLFGGTASNAVLNSPTVSSFVSQSSHSQNSKDLSELDHIMDILMGS
ncbi:Flavin reductase-like [Arapaima gigas]